MINSRHILNLSIELIIKAQASDKTFSYKCNVTKREAGRAGLGRFSKKKFRKVPKRFKKEKKFKKLDFQKSLKS
jgi:hypothetical protein